jgi:hypothetical protein
MDIFPKFYTSLLVKDEKITEGIKGVETLHLSAYWYQNSTDNLLKMDMIIEKMIVGLNDSRQNCLMVQTKSTYQSVLRYLLHQGKINVLYNVSRSWRTAQL